MEPRENLIHDKDGSKVLWGWKTARLSLAREQSTLYSMGPRVCQEIAPLIGVDVVID